MTLRHDAKVLIGRFGNAVLPGLSRDIDGGRNLDRGGFVKRAMIEARIVDARKRGDDEALSRHFRAYWATKAAHGYHTSWLNERESLFRNHHGEIVDRLVGAVAGNPAFTRFVEIGCGDGKRLADFAGRLPGIESFVGIDLNGEVIAKNLASPPADPRIGFEATDALDWLEAHPPTGTVLFSYNGVLEYFSPQRFDALTGLLARSGPAAIALVEPIAAEHDMATMPDSFPFGHESTFSHNHRHRLTKAGYRILFERILVADNIRWMMMVATTGQSPRETPGA